MPGNDIISKKFKNELKCLLQLNIERRVLKGKSIREKKNLKFNLIIILIQTNFKN